MAVAPGSTSSALTLTLAVLMVVAALFVGAAVAYLVVPMQPRASVLSAR